MEVPACPLRPPFTAALRATYMGTPQIKINEAVSLWLPATTCWLCSPHPPQQSVLSLKLTLKGTPFLSLPPGKESSSSFLSGGPWAFSLFRFLGSPPPQALF